MTNSTEQFKNEGYLHGQSKWSVDFIKSLKSEFDKAFAEKQLRFAAANHDINRWNMLLPSDSLMLKSGFFAENEIFDVIKGVYDHDFALVFFSSDISSPGSKFQTIHQDGNDFAVALNVPLVDSDELNGATHIYPKTHRINETSPFSNASNEFTDSEILLRASALEPLSLNVKQGDYTLRDLRLIHRGTPNLTQTHRPYLSAIFLPSSSMEAPTFQTIEWGLDVFSKFKADAFQSGRIDLIDYANTFGRLVMGFSYSDRVRRPIDRSVSDNLTENALYCLRFAKFEDTQLNHRITRNEDTSMALSSEIKSALKEFEDLKNQNHL